MQPTPPEYQDALRALERLDPDLLLEQARKVLAMHKPEPDPIIPDGLVCEYCVHDTGTHHMWPCRTVRHLTTYWGPPLTEDRARLRLVEDTAGSADDVFPEGP